MFNLSRWSKFGAYFQFRAKRMTCQIVLHRSAEQAVIEMPENMAGAAKYLTWAFPKVFWRLLLHEADHSHFMTFEPWIFDFAAVNGEVDGKDWLSGVLFSSGRLSDPESQFILADHNCVKYSYWCQSHGNCKLVNPFLTQYAYTPFSLYTFRTE